MTTYDNEKIDKIYEMVFELKTEVAKVIGQQGNHKETLDRHGDKISILDAYRNKTLGVVGIIGIFMGALAGWLIHLLSK